MFLRIKHPSSEADVGKNRLQGDYVYENTMSSLRIGRNSKVEPKNQLYENREVKRTLIGSGAP
jgi:hypothetical protein